ncbi:MAG: S8 family serine peptidase, partial [Bacteroidota bacterium]
MEITARLMEKLIFMQFHPTTRFTQDSPVYPDVWIEYFRHATDPNYMVDLILTPHKKSTASELLKLLSDKVKDIRKQEKDWNWNMATSGESVVASLTFAELIGVALPFTNWWQNYLWLEKKPTSHQLWFKELVGAILYASDSRNKIKKEPSTELKMLEEFRKLFDQYFTIPAEKGKYPPICLWSVSKNRRATISIEKSVPATKADAGRRVFDIDGSEIAWAILDTGIDARHDAFRQKDPVTGKPFKTAFGIVNDALSNHSRVVATYDFTKFRDVLAMIHGTRPIQKDGTEKELKISTSNKNDQALTTTEVDDFIAEIRKDLKSGHLLDWSAIAPLLRVPHNSKQYAPPVHPHGSHVAGIVGAGLDNKVTGKKLLGMCPNIDLYDIRVMNDQGEGEEFNIIAAIQFIRWMNNQRDGLIIHGVNLSFSMLHEVASFACGLTPVCEACDRLVAEGTVVVVAAGNLGQTLFQSKEGIFEQGFRMVNITDPGNAETVITVGSTHRNLPHAYGVSYFSSKGPTGDGRVKPDLVAPGEKIETSVGERQSFTANPRSGATACNAEGEPLIVDRSFAWSIEQTPNIESASPRPHA